MRCRGNDTGLENTNALPRMYAPQGVSHRIGQLSDGR